MLLETVMRTYSGEFVIRHRFATLVRQAHIACPQVEADSHNSQAEKPFRMNYYFGKAGKVAMACPGNGFSCRFCSGFALQSAKGSTPKSADGGDRTALQGDHELPQVREYAPHDTR